MITTLLFRAPAEEQFGVNVQIITEYASEKSLPAASVLPLLQNGHFLEHSKQYFDCFN